MEFQDWLGTIATVAIVCGATLALGRWLRTQTVDQFDAFKASVDRQFAVVNQCFADIDRRFGDIDRRFGDIDQRFQANQEDHAAIRRSIRESTQQVVGLMDRRFEDMGKRIDEMGKRMDEMGKRIDDLRSRVDSGGRAVLGHGHA